ncbi:MAG: immunoglobulin-like domain-containing protein [Bacillota bacterium]
MKKILTLSLVLLGTLSLAACGSETDEDQEHVDEARDTLVLAIQRDDVREDFDLPTELGKYPDVEITWESDNSDYVDAEGNVTRPEAGEGNERVTLTATLQYNDAEATREYTVTVIEKAEENLKDDFSELIDENPYGEDVTIQGIVSSKFNGGVFLWDGETPMAIYDGIQDDVELGDEIKYTGEYTSYHSLYQVTDGDLEVLSSDNDYDVEPTEISIADMYDYDAEEDDRDVHGRHFIVEGEVTQKGEYDNLYIESLDSDHELEVYYQSMSDSISALEDHVGDVVELEVIYYTYYDGEVIRVSIQVDEDDITVVD